MLLSLLLLLSVPLGMPLSLLLIGDSLDRHMSQEWCDHQHSVGVYSNQFAWGSSSFRYSKGMRIPSWMCTSDGYSIASVHVYGSNDTGPYFHNYISTTEDPYIDTKARAEMALGIYLSEFGTPDRIILHTAQWDLQYWYDFFEVPSEHSALWNRSLTTFEKNINTRLDHIAQVLGNRSQFVDLGLRTAVWEKAAGHLLKEFNNVIRKIASTKNLTLFDYDKEVWGTVGFDYSQEPFIFRDWIHPKPCYSVPAADKLLGRRYTGNMIFRGPNAVVEINKFMHFGDWNNVTVKLLREIGGEEYFYYNPRNHTLWRNPHMSFLRIARIGPAEALTIPTAVLRNMTVQLQVPYIYDERSTIRCNRTGEMFTIDQWLLRRIPPVLHQAFLKSGFIHDIEVPELLREVQVGYDMPPVFEGAVVQLRGVKEIFYFKNGTKHSIPNMNVFISLGKDLDEVVHLTIEDFNSIPLGDPLK